MAHKKGLGSSKNGRDSNSQRLGIKRFGGEFVRDENAVGHSGWRWLEASVGTSRRGCECRLAKVPSWSARINFADAGGLVSPPDTQ